MADVIQCDQCARYGKPDDAGWLRVTTPDRFVIRRDFCCERCLALYYAAAPAMLNPHNPPTPAAQPDPPAGPVPVLLDWVAFYVRRDWKGITGGNDLQRDFDNWRASGAGDQSDRVDPARWRLIGGGLPGDVDAIRETLNLYVANPVLESQLPRAILVDPAVGEPT